MLPDTGTTIILVVPASVSSIDPVILEGRIVTIEGDKGTYAESFAFENGLKFIEQLYGVTTD